MSSKDTLAREAHEKVIHDMCCRYSARPIQTVSFSLVSNKRSNDLSASLVSSAVAPSSTDLPAVMVTRSGAGSSKYGMTRARWAARNI